MPKILSIQSEVAGARVGNGIARFAMERLGVTVIALPTTLFGRRPDRGSPGGGATDPALLASMLDALDADGALAGVDFVLSGYIARAAQADVVLDAVARTKAASPHALYACDPVMGDRGRAFVSAEVIEAQRLRLAPAADILAPNAFELGLLAGVEARTLAEARAAADSLGKLVLVTSAPGGPDARVLHACADGATLIRTARAPIEAKGAGDLFAALYLARRALGAASVEAAALAARSVADLAESAAARGEDGLDPVGGQSALEAPRARALIEPA